MFKSNEGSLAGVPGTHLCAALLVLGLLVLPWLWSYTPGPDPQVVPLLASWACAAVALPILLWLSARGNPVRLLVPAAWLVAACASAGIAMLQWFGGAGDLWGISPSQAGEAYGNLRQRNHLATLTSIGLIAALWFRAQGQGRGGLWALAALLACGNAVSVSRTGLLQWLLMPLLIACWPATARRPLAALWVFAASVYLAAAWLMPHLLFAWTEVDASSVFGRVNADLGCSSRAVLWSNVVDLALERPLRGWGAGGLDYAHYAHLYGGPRFCDILDNAHNLPLHLTVEWGAPVGLAVCGAISTWVIRRRLWSAPDIDTQLGWSVLAVIGLHSMLEHPLWYGPFQLAVLLAVALIMRPPVPRPRAVKLAVTVSAVMVSVLTSAAYDYDTVSQAYLPQAQRRASMRDDPVRSAGGSWFFEETLRFAELATTPVTHANAPHVHVLAARMLHHSPEPQVIEKMIESSAMLGRDDEALWHAARYRAAFPDAYRAWEARR